MKHSIRITVKGRVQGVHYRANAQKQALGLNITGYAKNLDNGDVEVVAIGHPEALRQLADWCGQGPMHAQVVEIIVQDHPIEESHSHFAVL